MTNKTIVNLEADILDIDWQILKIKSKIVNIEIPFNKNKFYDHKFRKTKKYTNFIKKLNKKHNKKIPILKKKNFNFDIITNSYKDDKIPKLSKKNKKLAIRYYNLIIDGISNINMGINDFDLIVMDVENWINWIFAITTAIFNEKDIEIPNIIIRFVKKKILTNNTTIYKIYKAIQKGVDVKKNRILVNLEYMKNPTRNFNKVNKLFEDQENLEINLKELKLNLAYVKQRKRRKIRKAEEQKEKKQKEMKQKEKRKKVLKHKEYAKKVIEKRKPKKSKKRIKLFKINKVLRQKIKRQKVLKQKQLAEEVKEELTNVSKTKKDLAGKIREKRLKPLRVSIGELRKKQFKAELVEMTSGNKIISSFKGIKYTMKKFDGINNFSKFRVRSDKINTKKELFDLINFLMRKFGDVPFITLWFCDKSYVENHNGVIKKWNKANCRGITINSNHLDDYQDFNNRIEEISSGNLAGSDPVNENIYTLLVNVVDLIFVQEIKGFGKSDKIFYKTHKIDADGVCAYECIKILYPEKIFKLTDDQVKALSNLIELEHFIENNKLQINIIGNTYKFRKSFYKLSKSKKKTWEVINNKKVKLFKLNIKDVKYPTLYDCRNKLQKEKKIKIKNLIVFDIENKHYDVINGNVALDNIYCDNGKNIYKLKGKIIANKDKNLEKEIKNIRKENDDLNVMITNNKNKEDIKEINKIIKDNKKDLKKLKSKEAYLVDVYKKIKTATTLYKDNVFSGLTTKPIIKKEYLGFDYETIVDWDCERVMKPYSVSIFHCDDDDLKYLDELDMSYNKLLKKQDEIELKKLKKRIQLFIDRTCHFYLGYDCSEKFVNYIKSNQINTTFTLMSFNGANFDNFILLYDLLKYEPELVSDIFYNNTQLLNFKISKRHTLFDIRKHLTGSLKHNCKSFNIASVSKKEFDYRIAQREYDNENLIKYMNENKETIENYNNYDVLSMGLIFWRYKQAITSVDGFEEYGNNLHNHKTIGSLIYKRFKEFISKDETIELPKLHKKYGQLKYAVFKETYNDIKDLTKEEEIEAENNETFTMDDYMSILYDELKYALNSCKTNLDIKIILKAFSKKNGEKMTKLIYDLILKENIINNNKTKPKTKLELKQEIEREKLAIKANVYQKINKMNAKERKALFNKIQERQFKYYKDILKYKIAGRVELFNGIQYIKERVASIDVCSLYPYICAVHNCYFPCGKIVEINRYEDMPNGKIGFFYCDIDQSELKNKNLPLIICEKTKISNEWGSKKELKGYFISSIMIKLLKKHISKDKLKIYNGIYFTEKVKNFKIFGFLLKLMIVKNQQDEYKRNKNSKYNPSLRQAIKLLMNAISGKVIEKLHINKIVEVNSYKFEEIKKNKNTESINCINIVGNRVFTHYKVKEMSEFNRHRPIYLGVLIYDYSKRYMYDHIFSKIGLDKLIYTDTDSCKIRYTDFQKWFDDYGNKQIVPHWDEIEKIDPRYKTHKLFEHNSKVFGSLEDELEADNNINIFVAKKNYVSLSIDKDNKEKKKSHFCFKGISKNDILLDLNENFIELHYYLKSSLKYKKIGDILIDNKTKKIVKENDIDLNIYRLKVIIPKTDIKNAYKYYTNDKVEKIKDNYRKIFNRLFYKKEAFILTQNISKSVNNMKRNVGLYDEDKMNKTINRIILSFSIKRITIKDVKPDYKYKKLKMKLTNIELLKQKADQIVIDCDKNLINIHMNECNKKLELNKIYNKVFSHLSKYKCDDENKKRLKKFTEKKIIKRRRRLRKSKVFHNYKEIKSLIDFDSRYSNNKKILKNKLLIKIKENDD